MSIFNLLNSQGVYSLNLNNVDCNNLNASEMNIIDQQTTNILCENLTCSASMAITGDLEITNNTNPFVNLSGTQNQVLTLGANNQLVFTSIGGGGSGLQAINTNTPSELQITEANNVATINFIGGTSSIQSVQGTANEITSVNSDGNVVLSFPSQVNVQNLTASNSLTVGNVSIPSTKGTIGECIGVDSNGNVNFIPVSASGAIQSVQGTTNEITATTNNENVILSLPSQINLTNVDISNNLQVGDIVYPKVLGSNNQVLGVSNNALAFINQSGGGTYTAGTNIDIANNEISLSNNLNFNNNTCSIQMGPTNSDNINITESAIVLSDKVNNTNITIDGNTLSLVNNTGETIVELNPNGVYAVEYAVVNNAGSTLYKLPNNITGVANGEVLAFNGATNALNFVSNGSGNYTAGNGITLNNNQIAISNNISLDNNTCSIQLGETSSDNVLLQDNNITIKDATNNYLLEMDGNGVILSDVNTSGTVFEVNSTGVFAQNYHVSNNAGSTLYSLPQSAGSANQVLSMPSSGTQCVWTTVSGSVSQINGSQNVDVSANTGNVTVSLPNAILLSGSGSSVACVQEDTFNSQLGNYSSVIGPNGANPSEMLTLGFVGSQGQNNYPQLSLNINNNNKNGLFAYATASDTSDLYGVYANDVMTIKNGNDVIQATSSSLTITNNINDSVITATSITSGGSISTSLYTLPITAPSSNQMISTNGTGQLVFSAIPSSSSVQGSANITVNTVNNISTVSLNNNPIVLTDINSDTTLNSNGLQLTDTSNNDTTITSQSIVNNSQSVVQFSLDNTGLFANSISQSNANGSILYKLPTSLPISANQVIAYDGITSQLTWIANGSGSGLVEYKYPSVGTSSSSPLYLTTQIQNDSIYWVKNDLTVSSVPISLSLNISKIGERSSLSFWFDSSGEPDAINMFYISSSSSGSLLNASFDSIPIVFWPSSMNGINLSGINCCIMPVYLSTKSTAILPSTLSSYDYNSYGIPVSMKIARSSPLDTTFSITLYFGYPIETINNLGDIYLYNSTPANPSAPAINAYNGGGQNYITFRNNYVYNDLDPSQPIPTMNITTFQF